MGPVATDDRNLGVPLEPGRDQFSGHLREEIQHPMRLQVNDEGTEAPVAAEAEFIDAHGRTGGR